MPFVERFTLIVFIVRMHIFPERGILLSHFRKASAAKLDATARVPPFESRRGVPPRFRKLDKAARRRFYIGQSSESTTPLLRHSIAPPAAQLLLDSGYSQFM